VADINLRVVDIYHNDNVTSFQQAADSGLWGLIHKATTGATGKDSEYANRRQPALDAGLLWGAYHWGTAAVVQDQVDNFLNVAQPDANTLVALDFEETEGNQMTLEQASEFLTLVADAIGRKPVLYCGGLFKTEMGSTSDLSSARTASGWRNTAPTRCRRRAGSRSGSGSTPIRRQASLRTRCPASPATATAISTATPTASARLSSLPSGRRKRYNRTRRSVVVRSPS